MAAISEDADRFERMSRYLSGQLNDLEAAQFEGDWAHNPAWTKELEIDARVRAGLSELRRCGQLKTAMRGPWWFKSLRLLTLAASVAAIGVAVWAWQVAEHSGSMLLSRTPAHALGDSVAIMRLRQASAVSGIVELPSQLSSIELRVMPDVTHAVANATYVISLAPDPAKDAHPASTVQGLVIGKDGFVRAYVDSNQILPGRYRLTLRRQSPSDASPLVAAAATDSTTNGLTIEDQFLIDVRRSAAIHHAD